MAHKLITYHLIFYKKKLISQYNKLSSKDSKQFLISVIAGYLAKILLNV